MTRKAKNKENIFNIPEKFDSVEQFVFIGSWIDFKQSKKISEPITFFGIDLLSRKIYPDLDKFISILSDILNRSFTIDAILRSEFVVPISLIKSLSSEDYIKRMVSEKGDEVLSIWINIASFETIEFINHLLGRIKGEPVDNGKAFPIVNRLLLHFSTGQLWALAYKTNQKLCELILTKRLERKDYTDLFLSLFLEKGLYYIQMKWDLKPFKRLGFQCKQSDFSKFFFDRFLGICENGFILKPKLT